MKKIFYFLILFAVIIGAAIIIIPTYFKDDIKKMLVNEMDNVMEAKTDFKDFDLSLFRSFPHFSAAFNELSIVGKDEFTGDTLAKVQSLQATIDLISVFDDNPIKIISIMVDKPKIYTRVAENGKANYDIFDGSDYDQNGKEESTLSLSIQKVIFNDAHIVYDDPTSDIFMEIKGLNHRLSGNLTAKKTFLTTKTHANSVNITHNNIAYLSNQTIDMDVDITAVFDSALYKISNNKILINEVPLEAAGYVRAIEKGLDMDLAFHSTTKRFKPLLSLIPSIYMSDDFKSIQTDGELNINAKLKGLYSDNNMPAYQANVNVKDAFFKYPDLPSKVDRINMNLDIQNNTGKTTDLIVNADAFSFYLDKSFFNGNMLLKNIATDPYIKSRLNGAINLANLNKVLKMESVRELFGKIELDLNLNGNLSAIENKAYDNFKALGYINFEDFKMDYSNMKVNMPHAQFNFSPEYVNMTDLDVTYNQNDISAKGKISNILGYLFKDQLLSGNIDLTSKKINVMDLLGNDTTENSTNSNEDSEISLPKNMDITINTSIDEVIYDNITLNHVNGNVHIGNQSVTLNNLSGDALSGKMSLNGSFKKLDISDAYTDIHFNLADVSVKETLSKFDMFQKLAPILQKAIGKINLNFNLRTTLDKDLNIIYPTLFSDGLFQSSQLAFADANTLNQLAEQLKINAIKQAILKDINVDFLIEEGNLIVKPFDFNYKNISGTLAGKTNLNKNIDYELKMDIPTDLMGSNVNQAISNLSDKVKGLGIDYKMGNTLPLVALIGGNISNPKLQLQLFKGAENQSVQDIIEQQVNQVVDTIKTEINHQINQQLIEAEKKAKQLMEDAHKKANILIEKANVAAQKVKEETDAKAAQIIEKAKNENILVKQAAKESAKELKKKGYQQADNISKEAKKQADNILKTAKENGDKLINEAKKVK